MKKIVSLVLAALLLAFALLMLLNVCIMSLEWIRVHINLIEALFDGQLSLVFRNTFANAGVHLEARGFGAFVNYVYYNADLLIKLVIAGISACVGILIGVPILKKKEN